MNPLENIADNPYSLSHKLEGLYRHNYLKFKRTVRRQIGHRLRHEDAQHACEEIIQEVFTRLLRKAESDTPPTIDLDRLENYVMGALRNYTIDYLRSSGARNRLVAADTSTEEIFANPAAEAALSLEEERLSAEESVLAQEIYRCMTDTRRMLRGGKITAKSLEVLKRDRLVLGMRLEGYDFDEISRRIRHSHPRLKCANKSAAYTSYQKIIKSLRELLREQKIL